MSIGMIFKSRSATRNMVEMEIACAGIMQEGFVLFLLGNIFFFFSKVFKQNKRYFSQSTIIL